MTEFSDFLLRNWMLFGAWALVAGLLLFAQIKHMSSGPKSITTQTLTNLVNREDAIVVDIRGQADFNKGHISGAVNMPLSQIKDKGQELEKYQGKPIIMVCANGISVNGACDNLRKSGIQNLYKLTGGMSSWTGDNLPLVKS